MQKLLLLSDLHFGKKLKNYDLSDEIENSLEQVYSYLDKETVKAVIVAGDVFDKSIPSHEALKCFEKMEARLEHLRQSRGMDRALTLDRAGVPGCTHQPKGLRSDKSLAYAKEIRKLEQRLGRSADWSEKVPPKPDGGKERPDCPSFEMIRIRRMQHWREERDHKWVKSVPPKRKDQELMEIEEEEEK